MIPTPNISGLAGTRRYARRITIPAPAAGADWSTVVPGGRLWELLSVFGSLTASAAAVTRRPRLIINDGSGSATQLPANTNLAASTTNVYTWAQGATSVSAGTDSCMGIPDMFLPAGWTISAATLNLDVADQWSAVQILVNEYAVRVGPVQLDQPAPLGVVVIAGPES